MTTFNEVSIIPFSKLTLWSGNARKTGIEAGLDELAASIAAHGLLNPLTVRPAGNGKYAVIAGQRRYLALQRLVKAKAFKKSAPFACTFAAEDADDGELSLAENVVRVAMHPADQFEAWRDRIERGATPAEIADRFGVPEATVKKRLALARVSPRLFDLYRQGDITLQVLEALTVTDDHALQESVWDGAESWQRNNPRSIRQALTQGDIPTTDKRVQFVTVSAYEEAGGTVRRDLFDADGGGYVQDAALLDRLVRKKLDALAAEVKAEGWAWTDAMIEFGCDDRAHFERGEAEAVDLSPETEAEHDALIEEHDALMEDDSGDDHAARMEAIEARLDEIEDMRTAWPEALKPRAGAVISLAHGGAVEIERGLIRPEDAEVDVDELEEGGPGEAKAASGPPPLPASLIEDLTAQKTAALRIETARNKEVALALTVHALTTGVFYRGRDCVLKAQVMERSLRSSIRLYSGCSAVTAFEQERQRIRDLLPGQHSELWEWCLAADRETLLDVLAVTAAHGIDAVQSRHDPDHAGHGEALAAALNLDMAAWYRPTAQGYFSRVSKAQILADLEAAKGAPGAPSWAKLKKSELAELAERETAERGWLPSPLH